MEKDFAQTFGLPDLLLFESFLEGFRKISMNSAKLRISTFLLLFRERRESRVMINSSISRMCFVL